jgi:sucrose-6-phosphate hydrolase SacC (GH32 family)
MKPTAVIILFFSFLLLNSSVPPQETHNEKYRPQYHFSPEKNFLGNPAGLVYLDGDYHLFYQYNPAGKEAENLHLGHAISKDLLHWDILPEALKPDALPGDTLCNSLLSGSIIIDRDNILGFQQGDVNTLVLFYSEKGCGQQMAYSIDRGKTWKNYDRNPVVPYDKKDEARHSQVFWHQPSHKWVMALFRKPDGETRKQGFSFYTSSNLVNWELQGHLAGFFENPYLMELKVNNRPDDTRWVIMESNGNYILGHFNGFSFIPESIRMKSDFGTNFTAAQTFTNIPPENGRIIQIAGMKDGEWPDMPFSGQFTFPNELALKKINSGIFLTRQPVKEIEKLYGKQFVWKNEKLIPGLNKNLIHKIQGNSLRIKGRFDLKDCDAFGFMLKVGKRNAGTELMYNVKRGILSLLGQSIVLAPIDNKITLDILIDRSSVEVYANGGLGCISAFLFAPESDRDYMLFNNGGELLVEELTITEINSVYLPGKK